MAARIHRIGSIFSRVDGLIRKGHIKPHERPVWYDVYKAFPPKYEPIFKRRAPEMDVTEIFYPEDTLRALIQKDFHKQLGPICLNDSEEVLSEKLLKICQGYISEGLSEKEALEKLNHSAKEPGGSKDYQRKSDSEKGALEKSNLSDKEPEHSEGQQGKTDRVQSLLNEIL